MKKVLERWKSIFNVLLICLLMMFLSPSHCFSQLQKDTYEYHMEMAAKKLLIIGGSGIVVGTSVAILGSSGAFSSKNENALGEVYSTLGSMVVAFVGIGGGTVVSLISIPQFIGAKKHRKKAILLQPVVQPVQISGTINQTFGVRLTF